MSLLDAPAQQVSANAEFVVTGNQPQVLRADAQQRDRLGNRHVNLLGGIDGSGLVMPVSLAGARASRAMARPIRLADEPPPVRLPTNPPAPDRLRQPAHHHALQRDRRRRRAPRGHVLVEHAGQQVSGGAIGSPEPRT